MVEVEIPPLRERPEDIAPLAQHFARQLVAAARDFVVPEATLRNYMAQRWPGNARELRNAIARLVSLGEPTLDTLPPSRVEVGEHGASFDVDLSIPLATARDRLAEVVERAYIEAALRQSGHNVTRAAELAGVSRKFVQRAMKRFGLREPR